MKNLIQLFLIQFLFLFFGLFVPQIFAETFVVTRTDDPAPNGCAVGDCSLREALIAANDDNTENHTIQLTSGLTYTLSISGDVYSGPVIIEGQEIGLDEFSTNDGEGALKILNTERTIRIEATGGSMATIDADGTGPVFMILDETVAELDGLEITGGDNSSGGGFIVAYNESLTITNSLITGNTARSGAGMDVQGGVVVIEDSEISQNESISDGVPLAGAMSIDRAPLYQDITTIEELQNDLEWAESNVIIQNSTVSNNTAEVGGAFNITRSTLNVIESTVSGNRTYERGGAFYISRGAIVTVDRSTISGNIARNESGSGGRGAAFFVTGIQNSDEAAEVLIINSTISGNETGNGVNSGTAGGMYVDQFGAKNIDIINSTITNNTGWSIGGVLVYGGIVNIANTIIANQGAGDDCQVFDQGGAPFAFTSLGYNLESETSCGFTETGDLQNSDPLLGPLQDNGGPVFTHAITGPLSPAVNNGSNSLYTSEGGDLANDTDANGNDRVYDFGSGGIIDIGSFELQQDATFDGCPVTNEDKVLFVKKGENGTGANWGDALGEFRDALALFENETCTTEDVEEIWVTAGTYLPTDDSGDQEATFMMPGVNIYGGFEGDETNRNQRDVESNVSILSGEINDDSNLSGNSYHVVTSMDEESGLLSDFTITGGNANGSDPHNKGGGLYASNGGISMSNVLFENNYAETAGGGAYVIETVSRIGAAHPKFSRTTFRNNETGEDGDGGGLVLINAESRITAVTFENNDADRYGGGLFNDQSAPVIKNVIFKENSAGLEGGGMLNNISSPQLFNVLIANNNAFVNGGGMVNGSNSNPELTNVTISENDAEIGNGGGLYNRNGASPIVLNTIVWGNTASGTGNEIWNSSNSSIDLDYSLFGDETDDVVNGDGFTALNSWTTNPQLADAAGGDFTLTSSSPAINTGDPDTDMSDFKLFGPDEIDLAENPRVYNGDVDVIDIGAYEFQGEPTDEPEFAPFITTWIVEAEDLQITIPTAAGQTYNYDVDWGDGESDTGLTGDASHTYDSADTYTVKITGTFPQIEFFNADDKDKILSVEQWGDIEWASMRKAFQGAAILEINASDTPDLSNATSMLEMFSGATSVNEGLENWDVSTITSMFGLFDGATSFNGDISGWDVSAATDMIRMFARATAFNRDIGGWTVDNVNTMESMFDGATSFNKDLSSWNTGGVSGMSWMFHDASAFNQELGDWDISNVSSMTEMLDGSGLSQENYDNTLIGWENGTVKDDVELGADGLEYCAGKEERQALIDNHNWTITGDSEASECTEPVTLNAPILTSPSDEATNIDRPVTLAWNSVTDATSYSIQLVETSGSFDTPLFDDTASDTDIEVTGLNESTEYKWRVRAESGETQSEWSEVWIFTTNAEEVELGIPQLAGPADEATDTDLTVMLNWDAATGAESYQAQLVEQSGSFDTPDFDDETTDTEIEVSGLNPSTEYKWRVRALATGEQGTWSAEWTFTTTGLPEGDDQRILVSNDEDYLFSKSDFGISNNDFAIKIESLPDEGTLLFEENPVNLDDEISIQDINADKLTWEMPEGEYGYNFTSFGFRILDDNENQSESPYTLTIDLGTVFAELAGNEGWRFMSNPSDFDSYFDLFSGITVQTAGPPSQTLYELDQENYEWDPVASTGDEPGIGTPFIVYVLQDDLPVTVESGDNWNDLDGSFSYPGLDYDPSEPNPDNFYLIANPHPIALDFCQFSSENIATSAYFWDPEQNDGEYITLNCEGPDEVYIAPFQSLWIRTTGANPSLGIPENSYLGESADGYFKDDQEKDDQFLLTLNVTAEQTGFENRLQLFFSDDASEGLDKYDAPKLSSRGLVNRWLSFYSTDTESRPYAFQSIPTEELARNQKVRIPLDIETTESGQFTMNWNLPENHVFSGSYYLKDNETGEVIELREGSTYSFEIELNQAVKVSGDERSAKSLIPTFRDADLEKGNHVPRFELLIATSGIDGLTELGAIPEDFILAQNYPNPFNPTTVISYQLPVTSEVRLEVYDMLGRQVATLINEQVAAGRHTVSFDASRLSSGVYLYRLQAGSQIMTKKLTILK